MRTFVIRDPVLVLYPAVVNIVVANTGERTVVDREDVGAAKDASREDVGAAEDASN